MSRSRLLKPGFFKNEQLAELPFEARLCFAGLWTLADREGRLEDRPKRIDAELFPYDAVDMDGLLVALADKGLIRRYVVVGRAVIDIPTFLEHQKPHMRESVSELPPYQPVVECTDQGAPQQVLDLAVSIPVSDSVSKTVPETVKGGSVAVATPPFLTFPTVGPVQGWTLSEAQVAEWAELFPNLDVRGETRKALAWVHANPGRRKTAKGMPKMLVGWLSRATDSGRGRTTAPAPRAPLGQPARDWSCRHDPPCPVGTSAFRCDQRTTLEAGRKAKAAS